EAECSTAQAIWQALQPRHFSTSQMILFMISASSDSGFLSRGSVVLRKEPGPLSALERNMV
ncbi:MAG TPA: hypothetical protein PLN42_12590, partial [Anaerolineae bacterium]|nr:hypothetical protein [Anaerolineae bacterium]